MARNKDDNGVIIYEGPSLLDGAPIVAIATGLKNKSENAKTGAMVQIFVIRSDMHPVEAVNTGADVSICGNCVNRGTIMFDEKTQKSKNIDRVCYVRYSQSVAAVFRCYKDGGYPIMTVYDIDRLFSGRKIRLGAYGDLSSIPLWILDAIGGVADSVTGYTHQYRDIDTGYNKWLMASCDTAQDRFVAKMYGYRSFRIRGKDESLGKNEVVCPASAENNHKSNCTKCKMCGGKSSNAKKDIAIMAHGALATNFYKRSEDFVYRKAV